MAGFYTSNDPTNAPAMPPYMQKTRKTSTTTGEVTPENYQKYYQAVYGGVPMGVDEGALSRLYQENVEGPGMDEQRRASERAAGGAGLAPGSGYTTARNMRMRGMYGSELMKILSQAMGQSAQNQLAARGQIAGMMGRGGTTTSEESETPVSGGFRMSGSGRGSSGYDSAAQSANFWNKPYDWRRGNSDETNAWNAAQGRGSGVGGLYDSYSGGTGGGDAGRSREMDPNYGYTLPESRKPKPAVERDWW